MYSAGEKINFAWEKIMSFVLLLVGLGLVLNDMLWSLTYFCAKFSMSREPFLDCEAISCHSLEKQITKINNIKIFRNSQKIKKICNLILKFALPGLVSY